MEKVKINEECIPLDQLVSVNDYAKNTGQTRANVYYHLKNKNLASVKIAGTSFIVLDNQEDEEKHE